MLRGKKLKERKNGSYRQSCHDEAGVGILPLKIRHPTKQDVTAANVSLVAFPRHDVIIIRKIAEPILEGKNKKLICTFKTAPKKELEGTWGRFATVLGEICADSILASSISVFGDIFS
jgi:hypothetical protein